MWGHFKNDFCGHVMGIVRITERSMVGTMCGVQLKYRKRSEDFMLGLNETIDQLVMVNSVGMVMF